MKDLLIIIISGVVMTIFIAISAGCERLSKPIRLLLMALAVFAFIIGMSTLMPYFQNTLIKK